MAPTSKQPTERPNQKPIDFVLKSFVLQLPQAVSVAVAGTFNDWDPRRTPLKRDPIAGWKTAIWLPKGRYEYRFVVDGRWLTDPKAKEAVKNPFGSSNSVLVV